MKSFKLVHTALFGLAAKGRFGEFAVEWGGRYSGIVQLWRSFWAELMPFLEYGVGIRRVICTTNAIESINARYRRAGRGRGRFLDEAAVIKHFCLAAGILDPTGGVRACWAMRWEPVLNAFAITLTGRLKRNTHRIENTGPHSPLTGQTRVVPCFH